MKKIVLLSLFSLILFGCNSDPKEIYSRQIRIESNPSGAAVIVNSFKLGKTPIDVSVETTEDGCFVNKTSITIIPVAPNHFTQIETFSGYRKSTPNASKVPEKLIFDLTKNPEKEKTLTIE